MPSQYFLFPPCPLNGSRFAAGEAVDEARGLGSDDMLFLTEQSWFWSCSSSSLIRSLNRSISLSRRQSIRGLSKGAPDEPDCVRKCPNFARPLIATLFTSALTVVAWVIAITLDAMCTTPIASSGDLGASGPCRHCR